MMFLWHHALWLTLALPALAGAYVVLLRRKNHPALRYAGFGLVREAVGTTRRYRPHIPPLLLLLGLTALLLGVARPVWVITSPSAHGTVVLLMDVSLSMAAADVPPTRLAAAQSAAMTFVKAQPPDVRIAVVAFGAHADLVQPPTSNRADVMAALGRLELQRFTAIGTGLIAALQTIDPGVDIGEGHDIFGGGQSPRGTLDVRPPNTPKPVAPGSYLSAAVILVSDGVGTMGIAPVTAAKLAADLGIRVFTVGVGTLYGGVANTEGWPPIHAEFNEKILKEIAHVTRGEYFEARTAEKLTKIYAGLGRRVVVERTDREITALFAAIGVVLTLASAVLSLLWSSRPV